jgi:hypothetical protein
MRSLKIGEGHFKSPKRSGRKGLSENLRSTPEFVVTEMIAIE